MQLISMKHSIMTMNHMVHHRNPSRMFHRNELCMDHSFSPSQDSGPHENNLKLSMSKTRAPHYHPNSPIKSFCLRISILEKCLIIKTYVCLQPPYNHLYINLVVVNVTHILVKTVNLKVTVTLYIPPFQVSTQSAHQLAFLKIGPTDSAKASFSETTLKPPERHALESEKG